MRKYFIIVFIIVQQLSFGQSQIRNNFKTIRTEFGVQKLKATIDQHKLNKVRHSIIIDKQENSKKESFSISTRNSITKITGNDETGILYGCLELAEKIKAQKAFPKTFELSDAPEMVLRGQCIGLQKSTYLPGRAVYEYPYTPETFPWFYDKKMWIQVLDSMLDNRMNSLYLWNGHPFASLVKLKDYPYAVEVNETTFKKMKGYIALSRLKLIKEGSG